MSPNSLDFIGNKKEMSMMTGKIKRVFFFFFFLGRHNNYGSAKANAYVCFIVHLLGSNDN